jgi:hypothetical protein
MKFLRFFKIILEFYLMFLLLQKVKLVKGGFFAAVFFLPFFGCCWSQNSIIHHGQGRCVFDFGVEFFQVGFDWLISFCS